ncbi:MAG: DegQ family serine endoprotease [Thermodesulfobacteriaceae bacterium]|nr:DegQ family serine endoprotease [Thermodesulfobacteriaceae bacterium]MCX8042100.1 DegQ family serine endoprotease [Thermodesulfobacteriaceae bacterium]MDW8136488.1 DegQ family serine endoprotease [Thermodesulfobacterium sp.]
MIKVRGPLFIIFLIILSFLLGWGGKQIWTKFHNKGLVAEDNIRLSSESLSAAQKLSEAFSFIAEKAAPAVVYIETERVITSPFRQMPPMEFFGDEFFKRFFSPPRYKERGAGSGFILSKDGYIVTNNHVIEGAQKITVKLVDGRFFKAKVIGTDPFSDVALLKIEATNLPVLTLGNSDLLRIGEWVIAIGNPFGLTHTITVGVISAKGRSGIGISDIEDFIQTDAAINPGNSGGPLLNLRGEVIGMNTAIFTRSGGYMGIGFAIPINIVKTVVEQLKAKGKVERGWLGVVIQDLNPTLAEELGLKITEGVVITEVIPDSPAAKADLKEKDVIVAINKKSVKNASELRSHILLTKPGTEIILDIIRNGQKIEKKVTIEAPKKEILTSKTELEQLNNFLEELGFLVSDITPEMQKKYRLPSAEGVIIVEVIPESPADYARLSPGIIIDEVNRKKIKNLREFYQALKPSLQNRKVLLGIKTRYGRQYITLKLD